MIFLNSDTHWNHTNIITYTNRPFANVDQMNEAMVANWNAVVAPDDEVYHLGDFSMNFENAEKYVRRLNGKITLVMGNHDRCHMSRCKKPENQVEWVKKYIEAGFYQVVDDIKVTFKGVQFQLAHLPYEDPTDFYRDNPGKLRYANYRLPDLGVPQLCGHVHEKWLMKTTSKGTPIINVGVDAPDAPWSGQFRPATLDEVLQVYHERIKA